MNADASITVTVGVRIDPDSILTVKQAAAALSLNVATVRRFLREGTIKGSRKLGDWRIRGSELLKLA